MTLYTRARRHRVLPAERIVTVEGVPCADGLQALIDLAATLDDLRWEQALESALRKRLTTVTALEAHLPVLGRTRTPGTARIRRVLGFRPPGAPATESLLETLMVQLARTVPRLADPVRQFVVYDLHGGFVARIDLCWPDLGMFTELSTGGTGRSGEAPPYVAAEPMIPTIPVRRGRGDGERDDLQRGDADR